MKSQKTHNDHLSGIFCFFFAILLLPVSLFAGQRPIEPLPLEIDYDKEKAALGKLLFFDPGLSGDGSISCSHCHQFDAGGADGSQFSFGVDAAKGNINAPTVFNSRYNVAQFWNGRAQNLREQAKGPIVNPKEMKSSFEQVVAYVKATPSLMKPMMKAYGKVDIETVVDAIAEYEKTLVTKNSPFDQFLRGDENSISDEAKEGYKLFVDFGCISCHNGKNVGGNMFQKFGIFDEEKVNDKVNLGRYDVTGKDYDKYVFKVPSLRTAALTAPYFHTGKVWTLEEAVGIMANHQLGHPLEKSEIDLIVAFLKSLLGEIPVE